MILVFGALKATLTLDIAMNGEWESQWDSKAFNKYGYNVNAAHLWTKFLKLPFFSISASGDDQLKRIKNQEAYQTWLLKKKYVAFWVEKPIDKIETSDLRFDLDKMERKREPVEIQPTFVINNSQVNQILTRTIEYSTSSSEYYETTNEEQFGVKAVMKINKSGIEMKMKAGIDLTTAHTTGKETVETKTDEISAQIEISGKSKIAVTITGQRYTARVIKIFVPIGFGFKEIKKVGSGFLINCRVGNF